MRAVKEADVLERLYRLALNRAPTPREREAAGRYLRGRGMEEAGGRLRAWTDVAQAVFGLDEFAYLE